MIRLIRLFRRCACMYARSHANGKTIVSTQCAMRMRHEQMRHENVLLSNEGRSVCIPAGYIANIHAPADGCHNGDPPWLTGWTPLKAKIWCTSRVDTAVVNLRVHHTCTKPMSSDDEDKCICKPSSTLQYCGHRRQVFLVFTMTCNVRHSVSTHPRTK